MFNPLIALITYLIHRYIGDFKLAKHPLELISDISNFYNERFYKDSYLRGFLLILFVVGFVLVVGISIYEYLGILHPFFNILISSIIASLFFSYASIYKTLESLIGSMEKKSILARLVTEETKHMSESDLYKVAITHYTKTINGELIAPLFYLALLGLPGLMVYKTINLLALANKTGVDYPKSISLLYRLVDFIPSSLATTLTTLLFKKVGMGLTMTQEGKELALSGDLAKALSIDVQLHKILMVALAGGATVAIGVNWFV